jgi:hypothetical protein
MSPSLRFAVQPVKVPPPLTDETDKSLRREGAPDWIEDVLLQKLDGRLWHATTERAWRAIMADGIIRPDAEAVYRNGFCRSIGAVSLFDLSQPDSAAPVAATHWSAWLGGLDDEPRYWIEIDRAAVSERLLTPVETLARWRLALNEGSQTLRIIAGLEAAHLGPIALLSTCQVLRLTRGCLPGGAG